MILEEQEKHLRSSHGRLPSQTLRACETSPNTQGQSRALGDNVKTDRGYRAVLTEQGASASQVAAVLGYKIQVPGTVGEANDAVSTYTQGHTSESPRVLRLPERRTRTRVDKITSQVPTQWDAIEEPAVLFE